MPRTLILIAIVALAGATLVGCSVEENPVTPEKMQEIRKKEADERANFNPNMNAPKGN